MSRPTIGDQIAERRRRLPLTQEELAEAAGVSVETVYQRALAHPARIVRRVALYTAAACLTRAGMRRLLIDRRSLETELSSQLDDLLQDLAQQSSTQQSAAQRPAHSP